MSMHQLHSQTTGNEVTTSTTVDTSVTLHAADPQSSVEIVSLSVYTDAPQTAPIRVHVDVAGVRQINAMANALVPWLWSNRHASLSADQNQAITLVIAPTAAVQRVVYNVEMVMQS